MPCCVFTDFIEVCSEDFDLIVTVWRLERLQHQNSQLWLCSVCSHLSCSVCTLKLFHQGQHFADLLFIAPPSEWRIYCTCCFCSVLMNTAASLLSCSCTAALLCNTVTVRDNSFFYAVLWATFTLSLSLFLFSITVAVQVETAGPLLFCCYRVQNRHLKDWTVITFLLSGISDIYKKKFLKKSWKPFRNIFPHLKQYA